MSKRAKNMSALFLRFVIAYMSVCIVAVAIMRSMDIPASTFVVAAWFLIGSVVCDITRVVPPRPDLDTATMKDAYKTLWWFSWWPKYLVARFSR